MLKCKSEIALVSANEERRRADEEQTEERGALECFRVQTLIAWKTIPGNAFSIIRVCDSCGFAGINMYVRKGMSYL